MAVKAAKLSQMRIAPRLTWNERQVLHTLEFEARIPYAALGRKLGMSKETARNVVTSLERKGVIAGYYPVVNSSLLGLCLFHVFVRIPLSGPGARDLAVSKLSKILSVYWISRTGGKFDLLFGVKARDSIHFDAIFKEIQDKCRQHFKWIEVHSVISSTSFHRDYLTRGVGKKSRSSADLHSFRTNSQIHLTPLQEKLLQVLHNPQRLSLSEIALGLKQSRGVVRSQIARLQKLGVLTGFRAKIRAERFGYQMYRLMLSVNQIDSNVVKKFHDYGAIHPQIVHLDYALGRWNFQFTCEVASQQELDILLSELQEHMHPLIDDIDILMIFLDTV